MSVPRRIVASWVIVVAAVAVVAASAGITIPDPATRPRYSQASTNVFRRFAVDLSKMKEFYGEAIGLGSLPAIGMPGGGQMTRFHAGTSEVKLQPSASEADAPQGGILDVTGLRVLTFLVPNAPDVDARFKAHGFPEPIFRKVPVRRAGITSESIALVTDPSGQWVELIAAANVPDLANRLDIGVTVSDLERSRAFYRDFVGLEELPSVYDEAIGVTMYPFRLGTTTINLWQGKKGAPANRTSAGIQYVVVNVEDVDARAKARGITIDRPLGNFGANLRTVWLADPDGITNYFAQVAGRPEVSVR